MTKDGKLSPSFSSVLLKRAERHVSSQLARNVPVNHHRKGTSSFFKKGAKTLWLMRELRGRDLLEDAPCLRTQACFSHLH